jgi:hypothetical protein
MEASTAGEQSSVGPPGSDGGKGPQSLGKASKAKKAPARGRAQSIAGSDRAPDAGPAAASAGTLVGNQALLAEIVSRVTQSLLASTEPRANQSAAGQAPPATASGPAAASLPGREELLRSIQQIQEGLLTANGGRAPGVGGGAASPPVGPTEKDPAKLLAQQKRRLRKVKLGKPPALHDWSHAKAQLSQERPKGEAEAASSQAAGTAAVPGGPDPVHSAPPRQAPHNPSARLLAPTSSVPPVPAFSMPPPVIPGAAFRTAAPSEPSSYSAGSPFQRPPAPYELHRGHLQGAYPSTAPLLPGLSAEKDSLPQRRLIPLAPTPSAGPSQSASLSEAPSSAMFVDLRPKKKRGPAPKKVKDPKVRDHGGKGCLPSLLVNPAYDSNH